MTEETLKQLAKECNLYAVRCHNRGEHTWEVGFEKLIRRLVATGEVLTQKRSEESSPSVVEQGPTITTSGHLSVELTDNLGVDTTSGALTLKLAPGLSVDLM